MEMRNLIGFTGCPIAKNIAASAMRQDVFYFHEEMQGLDAPDFLPAGASFGTDDGACVELIAIR